MTPFNRLIRNADRLGQVHAGSPEADRTIHEVIGRIGTALPYTTAEEAAHSLLPAARHLYRWCGLYGLPAQRGGW